MKQTGRYSPVEDDYDLDAEIRNAAEAIHDLTEKFVASIPKKDRNKIVSAMISELSNHIE